MTYVIVSVWPRANVCGPEHVMVSSGGESGTGAVALVEGPPGGVVEAGSLEVMAACRPSANGRSTAMKVNPASTAATQKVTSTRVVRVDIFLALPPTRLYIERRRTVMSRHHEAAVAG
jgi:hypothetical protein